MYDYTVRDPMAPVATDHWLRPADSFDRGRFFGATGVGLALYGATSFGLYHAWYANFERRGLRSFDDWPEWNQMDKAGHVFSAYTFNRYAFAGLRWAGLRRSHSRIAALGVANLLQGTIELMDGYSAGWGFSWSDMGANVAGSLVFTLQDVAWREQRILLKVSNDLRPHPDVPVFNEAREGNLGFVTRQRFGQGHLERFLKDYNAQTIWASVNPKSFFPRSKLPGWLNVAVGYGSENVYGAYGTCGGRRASASSTRRVATASTSSAPISTSPASPPKSVGSDWCSVPWMHSKSPAPPWNTATDHLNGTGLCGRLAFRTFTQSN